MNAKEFIKYKKEQLAKNPFMYTKDIGRKGKHKWKIAGRSMMVAKDLDKKVFTFERMEYVELEGKQRFGNTPPNTQYRMGYYIVSNKGNWTWGQFTPMISSGDLKALLKLAKKEGVLLDN